MSGSVVYLGTVCLNGVMNVDEDEEDGDQQRHAARDDLGVHQEAGHQDVTLVHVHLHSADLIQLTTTNRPEGR